MYIDKFSVFIHGKQDEVVYAPFVLRGKLILKALLRQKDEKELTDE